jgi:hypothetical protein
MPFGPQIYRSPSGDKRSEVERRTRFVVIVLDKPVAQKVRQFVHERQGAARPAAIVEAEVTSLPVQRRSHGDHRSDADAAGEQGCRRRVLRKREVVLR